MVLFFSPLGIVPKWRSISRLKQDWKGQGYKLLYMTIRYTQLMTFIIPNLIIGFITLWITYDSWLVPLYHKKKKKKLNLKKKI
jgi:hypothetical protein